MSRLFLGAAPGVPPPTSPISHAVVVGDTCWISGQHALDAGGTYQQDTPRAEAKRCFELVFLIAEAAGFSRQDLVFVDIGFASLGDLAEVNALFEELFAPGCRPARTIQQPARLAFDAKVRVQAVAIREPGRPPAPPTAGP